MSQERAFIDFCVILFTAFQFVCEVDSLNCEVIYTCGECIQRSECGWCSKLKLDGLHGRRVEGKCLELTNITSLCELNAIEDPQPSIAVIRDENVKEDREGGTIQLQPQEVNVQLRVGKPFDIELKFKKASDYPIDLYYLVDFSKSMQIYKKRLSELGYKLAKEMETRTSSLQLGFGSFVDKVTLPFTSTLPQFIKSPCNGCASPYSFKNHMALSRNTAEFPGRLKAAKMSANEDTPEGGLDGLLQAMVCTKDINWRPQARRIIVFCSDAAFHIAGDGKLGGIVEPNDGVCHLDSTGKYTHDLLMDYPSISLINEKVKAHSMNIIFAITEGKTKYFESLKNAIEGSSMGILKSDEAIVNLVVDHYKNMSVAIALTDNAPASTSISYSAKCPNGDWQSGGRCLHLKAGDEVLFKATIKVLDCSQPEQTIEIKPIGMVETLTVKIKVYCGCDCEKPTHPEFRVKSKECSSSGNSTCGRCNCPKGYYGHYCECQSSGTNRTSAGDTDNCKKGGVTCSDRGTCICGMCRCKELSDPSRQIYGDYCECDNFSCPGATLCSGHGNCTCGGKCACSDGWTKEDCSCSTYTTGCLSPKDYSICSNRGDCVCGSCQCYDNKAHPRYFGKFCESCIGCKPNCTMDMHNCVECLVYKSGNYFPDKCENCSSLFTNLTIVDDVTVLHNNSEDSIGILCTPLDADEKGCVFQYVPYFSGTGDDLSLFVNKEKTCPKELNIIAISSGVAGSTLAAGIILLLLWKLFTTIHDKREYEKFERQRANTKWGRGDNPLYRKALTTHINPVFDEGEGVSKTSQDYKN